MKEKLKSLIEKASTRGYVRALKSAPEILSWVMEETKSLPHDAELSERVYCALHGVQHAICPNGNHKIFNTLDKGFRFCANNCQCRREAQSRAIKDHASKLDQTEKQRRTDQQRETFLAKYGVENAMHVAEIRKKQETTMLDRYGATSPFASPIVQEKIKETNIDRYGAETPLGSEAIREKIAESNLKKYGQRNNPMIEARKTFADQYDGLNPFQISEIAEKAKATMLSRYGVEKALESPEIYTKMCDALEQKHGVRNVMLLKSVRDDLAARNIERYGWPSPNQKHFGKMASEILTDPEKFKIQFEHMSLREVSLKLGIAYDTARKWCVKHGVELSHSTYEDAIAKFLQDQGLNVRRTDRKLIKPYELDIAIDDCKLAIEFCGLYWHSERHNKSSDYHLNKLTRIKENGWRLITIFEDEWLYKREIVEQRLLHAIGRSTKGVPARKLMIRNLSANEAKTFLDKHHTQGGGAYGFVNYGACDGDTIVAVMTFAKPRVALGRKTGAVELLRFATDGRNHPGVASRLFSAFIKEYSPDEIISYADRRWSEGDFYAKLGFVFERNTPPNYWYFHASKPVREYRFKYRKDKIKNLVEGGESMTERQIMIELGYTRIWDCGHAKFRWTNPNK